MPPPRSERALRRLVVELASLGAADIRAILSELDPVGRERVEVLLRAYAGPSALRREDAPFDTAALSPWLVERASPGPGLAMTARANEALRACAARLFPVSPDPVRPSLLGRIGAVMARRTRA